MGSHFPTKNSLIIAITAVAVAVVAAQRRQMTTEARDAKEETSSKRGRDADVPEGIPARGLRDVFWRVIRELSDDRVTLVAAGVTFYILLAIFPALAALVSCYGFFAEPADISEHLRSLAYVLPPGAFDLISDQMNALAQRNASSLSLTFVTGLAIALWSSHNGTMAMFDAMNIAYEEREKRGYVYLNLLALAFTIAGILGASMMIGLVAVMPIILSYVWLDAWSETMALVLRWPVLLFVVAAGITAIYRFGPSRAPAKLRWLTWGTAFTTTAWLLMSMGFSFYLKNFANYDVTYGTLGALIGFLMWTWLSVVIVIIGAEINAELEHQTRKDTTSGLPMPMGARGAYVADTLGDIQ